MMWTELFAGLGGLTVMVTLVGGLARWLAQITAARILEKDRLHYQTRMESLLQDLRTNSSKDLFIHQLQFEREFQIYLDLWKETLALGNAAREYRDLKKDSGKSAERQRTDFLDAHEQLNRRVYDHRPFYAPEVYDLANVILKKSSDVYKLASRERQHEGSSPKETLLDDINTAIDPLCEAIRRRIWLKTGPKP